MEEIIGTNINVSQLIDQGISLVITYAPKFVLAIITLVVGLWLINRFVGVLDKKIGAKDPTLNKFLCGLTSAVMKVMLLISVASMIGIATTSFIAVIGAAGLAIGLALQGSLANFAGGVLILIFKPFKVGDTIEAQGFHGAVTEIQILYTVVDTFDNRRIVIPNGSLSNATLVNVSIYKNRRCDMTFGIHYDDDIDKAKAILQRLFEEDERSLKDPEPRICVGSLGDNSVNLMFRPWVATDDLWPYYWDMHEKVKKAFDKEGITIPYPQRDMHIYKS
ncbi:mechanosensitive ion channel [Colwellia sp. MB02u-18]|uniref:mechanosensitive ion channel family protein n=1 Tax=unclassified Colwellia TaxID=196834 RepID=UPI0015F61A4B|nr:MULTISPECIES: mechanosensitive ion channel domain-containing protein [unclassified Colwellia]MBA6222769.1 mechanosensitive ion channel [Colwellia sp. MB3u-45]MBA6266024.1 mechanosensitive ion channel [Colwellia sp. MB3u-43]MBA6293656.1 mechanosensitive ion channel [Colwellia sp. MB3u-8]MBA6295912.1 mechanosensitive ion channel [Colwellia sp. MB02u-9]MBA6308917.1 mechanosensitive ion channel [Colwellia sp. MB3u-70]